MSRTLRLHQTRRSLLNSPNVPLKEARRRNTGRPTLAEKVSQSVSSLAASPGMILAPDPCPLRLSLQDLLRHMCIFSGSGSGKTKFLEQFLLQVLTSRDAAGRPVGGLYLDVHGDSSKELVAQFLALGVDPARILYIEPRMDGLCPALDPAAEIPLGLPLDDYEQQLSAVIDETMKSFLRNVSIADQEVMKRLKRWTKNVLWAGCVNDEKNTHVGLDKALVFTDPKHPEFDGLYGRVKDRLPTEVRADFEKLIATKSPTQQEAWVESTINLLRDLLSPILKLMWGQHAEALDFREAIKNGWIILANLAESPSFSSEQAKVIGGQLIAQLLGTARRVENEADRRTFFLVIDEAHRFISHDLQFEAMRKFRVPLIVSQQSLANVRKGDLDLLQTIVDNCGIKIVGQQNDPEAIEYWGKVFGYFSLDLTPMECLKVLPDAHDWVDTQSFTYSKGTNTTRSHSTSVTHTQSETHQVHAAESIQQSMSLALSENESAGWSTSDARGTQKTTGHSSSIGASKSSGLTVGNGWSEGANLNGSTSKNWSDSYGNSLSFTSSESHGRNESEGESHGESRGEQTTKGMSESSSRVAGESLNYSNMAHTRNASRTFGDSENSSRGQSKTSNDNRTRSVGSNHSESSGVAEGQNESHSDGGSESSGFGINWGTSGNVARTSGNATNATESDNRSTGTSVSHSDGRSGSKGKGLSLGFSIGRSATAGESHGKSTGRSEGETNGTAHGTNQGESVTYGKTPLAKHKIITERNGKLVVAIQDQLGKFMQMIAAMKDRTFLVMVKGMGFPFLIGVHTVKTPKPIDMAAFLAKMQAAHPCFFSPRAVCAARRAIKPVPPAEIMDEDEDDPIGG